MRVVKAGGILVAEFIALFLALLTISSAFPEVGQAIYRFSQSEGATKNVIGGLLFYGMIHIAWVLSAGKKKAPPPLPTSVPPVIPGMSAVGMSDSKKCPMCAEFIKADALVCKHCGHRFNEEEVEESRQALATSQRERAIAAEREKQRALLQRERDAVLLRKRKAASRRTIAWILVGILVFLSIVGFIGAVAGAKTTHPMVEGVTFLMSSVLFLGIPLGIPAILLLRSAKRLSQDGATAKLPVSPESSFPGPAAPSAPLPSNAATVAKDSTALSSEHGADEITFECPNCRQHLAADRTMSRQAVQCPGCHKELVIP